MAGNITLTIIKPEAVAHAYTGDILRMISAAGFSIAAMKLTRMSHAQAESFYQVHLEKPFYRELVEFMASGPIVAAILQKENAVEEYRKLIGLTDPAKAPAGTIRQLFGETIRRNAVHGSDSDLNAMKEAGYFFQVWERFDRNGSFLEPEEQ